MNKNPYKTPSSEVGPSNRMIGDLKLTSKSLFKLLFVGFFWGMSPFFLLIGFYVFITDGKGVLWLILLLAQTLSMTLVFSLLVWFFVSFGTWLYTCFGTLNLEFKE